MTSQDILIVEDEAHVRELVSHTLQGAGYQVVEATSGEEALGVLARQRPHLLVLDVRLPGIDGWEVCRRIRAGGSNLPILLLTALKEDEHVVKGLRLGADDYLAKPFSPGILAARVQALLRRARADASSRVVRLGNLLIDLGSAEVRRGEERIHLTATEFRILSMLARNQGLVINSRDLLRAVQGLDLADAEAQEIVKVHIRHLRGKLEPDPDRPRLILTVRSLGYMLAREPLEGVA